VIFIPTRHLDDPERVQRSMWAPATGSLDWQLDAVARRDARVAELNAPPQPVTPEADAVPEVVKQPTKTAQAKAWLADLLQHGPVPATTIESAGLKAGFNLKMLKDVKKRLRVVSVRKGANNWRWRLPMANEPKDDGD